MSWAALSPTTSTELVGKKSYVHSSTALPSRRNVALSIFTPENFEANEKESLSMLPSTRPCLPRCRRMRANKFELNVTMS